MASSEYTLPPSLALLFPLYFLSSFPGIISLIILSLFSLCFSLFPLSDQPVEDVSCGYGHTAAVTGKYVLIVV